MTTTIQLSDTLLTFELERKNIKRINLRIKPDGRVYVSAPRFTPRTVIDGFLLANEDAIKAALAKFAANVRREHRYEDGELFPLLGVYLPLRLGEGRKCVTADGEGIYVTVPKPDNADSVKKALEEFYRFVCERETAACIERLMGVFSRRGIGKPSLRYRRMKSKWGVCRPQRGEICFNTALAFAPRECIEYVVAHEMCHLLQANHSRLFYAELEAVIPDYKRRKKLLERYGAELF